MEDDSDIAKALRLGLTYWWFPARPSLLLENLLEEWAFEPTPEVREALLRVLSRAMPNGEQ